MNNISAFHKRAAQNFFLYILEYAVLVVAPYFLLRELELFSGELFATVCGYVVPAAAALLVLGIIFSIAALAKSKKKVNIREMRQEFDNTYDQAQRSVKDFGDKLERRSKAAILCIWLAFAFFLLASLLAPFASVFLFAVSPIFFIIPSNIIAHIVDSCISPTEGVLSKKEYPRLYGLVKKCAEQANMSKRGIRIVLMEDANAAVGLVNKWTINLMLGYSLIMYMSEDELSAIIFHELAHIKHKDIHKTAKYAWAQKVLLSMSMQKFALPLDVALLFWLEYYYSTFFELSNYAATLVAEIAADNMVKTMDVAQTYINANAKLVFLQEAATRILRTNYWESETPVPNIAELHRDHLYGMFDRFSTEWANVCLDTIPLRKPTHPTLSERMDNFGIKGFFVDIEAEVSPELTIEREKLLHERSDAFRKAVGQQYPHFRKEYYYEHEKTIKAYLTNSYRRTGSKSFDELRIGMAFEELGRLTEAKGMFRSAVQCNSLNVVAAFRLGLLLLDEYDDKGIDHTVFACKNHPAVIENGWMILGEYLTKRGLKERLDGEREWVLDSMQKNVDMSKEFAFNMQTKLTENEAPQIMKELIAEFASAYPCIRRVFLADKKLSDGHKLHFVCTELLGNFAIESVRTAYSELGLFLDTLAGGYYYSNIAVSPDSPEQRMISRVPNSLIYTKANNPNQPQPKPLYQNF